MQTYLQLLETVLNKGEYRPDRTGTGTKSVFGYQMRFNLQEGFPIITTKRIHLKSVIYELLWFLQGNTNVDYLNKHGVSIWNEWADEKGDLGPIYGYQWRKWKNNNGEIIDQVNNVIRLIKTDPYSRRLIVSAWNVGDLDKMALPPCHTLFQFYIVNNKLSCQLYQRSADIFLGVPFNIASYALLTQIIANIANLELGDFVHTIGDAHLYINHIEQAQTQLARVPFALPQMQIKRQLTDIDKIDYEDFELLNYQYHPSIQAPIAV